MITALSNGWRVAAVTLAATLAAAHAGTPATISSVEIVGDTATLAWTGGTGPFQPQVSRNLGAWTDLDDPTDASTATLTVPGGAVFYRVQDLGTTDRLGPHIGQVRVMQGEFGDIMARNRLKSLWDFHEPAAATPPSKVPSKYFRDLIVRYQHLDDNRTHTIVGTLESFPGAGLTMEGRTMTFSWSLGDGDAKRNFTLTLDFPYNINSSRATSILVSDPRYNLKCDYATPQPTIDFNGEVKSTRSDEADLAEVSPPGGAGFSQNRNQVIRAGGAEVNARYSIGLPVIEGSPPFIFKTFILQGWRAATTVKGLTTEPFELGSKFSRTYDPFHHNFVETLWLVPENEPGIDPDTLDELRAANVKIIMATNPTSFPGEQPQKIRVLGFDGSVREL